MTSNEAEFSIVGRYGVDIDLGVLAEGCRFLLRARIVDADREEGKEANICIRWQDFIQYGENIVNNETGEVYDWDEFQCDIIKKNANKSYNDVRSNHAVVTMLQYDVEMPDQFEIKRR